MSKEIYSGFIFKMLKINRLIITNIVGQSSSESFKINWKNSQIIQRSSIIESVSKKTVHVKNWQTLNILKINVKYI